MQPDNHLRVISASLREIFSVAVSRRDAEGAEAAEEGVL